MTRLLDGCWHPSQVKVELAMYLERSRVLVVDDFLDNLFMLQIVLEEEGYEVELAESGRSALEKILASPPNLVLLDVMMPQMNGIEVTRSIREHEQLATLPIVLVTAYEEEFVEQGLLAGANDWMRKPVNFPELLEKVQGFCRV